jgi:transposase InsO family protein
MLIEEFRGHYNEVRPHSCLDDLIPAELKKTLATTIPTMAIS